jgi:DNA (cytosine-5)-methyltransferase 1
MKGALRELGLFAGAGGGLLASRLLGWRTVCAVELDTHCQRVLAHRQRDGMLDPFPIWDDVRTFDGRPWRGHVDVISGGFPCQDISSAGSRVGIAGKRSGLWSEFARIIREVRPSHVFVENSPDLVTRGLGIVLGDLAALGFDARWDVFGARHVGAPHDRDRLWIVAHANRFDGSARLVRREEAGPAAPVGTNSRDGHGRGGGPWALPLGAHHRVVDGVASRLDRCRAVGNGQVPAVAALAWRVLSAQLAETTS